jgi:glycosyltransferase involved in cell wall biosynthesis
LASNLGSMAELVSDGKTGRLFNPGDREDLTQKARWMIENEDKVIEMGKNARAEFEAKYTAERNYEILMGIYQKAIENRKFRNLDPQITRIKRTVESRE